MKSHVVRNKEVYGSIAAFIAMFVVQAVVGWLNGNDVDVSPDQQAQLTNVLTDVLVSFLTALGAYFAIKTEPPVK